MIMPALKFVTITLGTLVGSLTSIMGLEYATHRWGEGMGRSENASRDQPRTRYEARPAPLHRVLWDFDRSTRVIGARSPSPTRSGLNVHWRSPGAVDRRVFPS